MPTATPFAALGAGNGFTICLDKTDVSSAPKWVTLGGTQKGNEPTDAEIKLSLKNAMKLFWDLNGITYNITSSSSTNPFSTTITIDGSTDIDNSPFVQGVDYTSLSWTPIGGGDAIRVNKEPHERVCYEYGGIYKNPYDSLNDTNLFYLGLNIGNVYRMYNGDINDESKFLGYGANLCYSGEDFYNAYWNFDLRSTGSDSNTEGVSYESSYVVLNGIYLVANFYNYNSQGESGSISNPTNSVVGTRGNQTYTLSNLNFYTY